MSNFGRRTWDREEYKKLAKDNCNSDSLLDNLDFQQFNYLKGKYTDHNQLIIESLKDINKKVLTANITSYKKGKQFGFYCDLCDMTFKDTLQYVDHLNHKVHQARFEQIFDEPLILDKRDNEELLENEFHTECNHLINQFVKNNTINNEMKTKVRTKRPVIPIQKSNSNINDVMGFESFDSTKK